MKLCTIADATVTHTSGGGGSTYLADVSLQDATSLSKLDLVSGRVFIWGFTAYAIQITRYLTPSSSPTAIGYVAVDVGINGHTFAGAWPIGWTLATDKQEIPGGFMLKEQLVYIWFKQNPPEL